jgi:hypothetical protein
MTVEEYERTYEQNELLGINYMNVAGFRGCNVPADVPSVKVDEGAADGENHSAAAEGAADGHA